MNPDTKQQIASDAVRYTLSVYAAQLLGMVGGILVRRFLEPAQMGVWVLLQTLMTYGLLAECGIFTSLYCQMPALAAKGDEAQLKEVRDVSFSFAFAAALLVGGAFLLVALVGWPGASGTMRLGWVAVALAVGVTMTYNFYVSYFWGTSGFRVLSGAVLCNAVLQLAAVLLLARVWGLKGMLVSMVLVPLATLLYAALGAKMLPRWNLNLYKSFSLIRFALPVFLTGLVYTFLLNLDRLMIARWLGTEALGHYSLALVAFSFSSIAPKMFSIVLFPRIQGEVAAGSASAAAMVLKPDRAIAFLSPVLLGGAYLFLPFLVSAVLPKYEAGLVPARTLLLGSYFLAMVYNAQSYLIALNKKAHPIPFLVLAAGCAWVSAVGLMHAGWGLNGIALSMGAGFLIYFCGVTVCALGRVLKGSEMAWHLSEIALVFLYFALTVRSISSLVIAGNSGVNFLAQGALFLVAYSPVLFWAEKRTGVWTILSGLVQKKLKGGIA